MNEIKLDMIVESFSFGFGRVTEIATNYFIAHFPYIIGENKERVYTIKDLEQKRIKILFFHSLVYWLISLREGW